MEKSIYQLICENINNGILDANFSLPAENKEESSVSFAPGAFDGICLYHMAQKKVEQAHIGQMAEAVERAASGNFPEADALFAEWTKEHRAIRIVDQLQDYVIDHADHLDPGNVLNAAIFLILHSSHVETVVLMSRIHD